MASRSWNRVEIIGNMTRDPEMRYTPSGAAVITFTLATNRTFVSDGEKKEEADFHRAVAWNKLAELCNQLLKKGNRVFISGRLQNRSWEDAQTKQTRYITEIVVEDMILLTGKSGEFGEYSSGSQEAASSAPIRSADEMPAKSDKGQGTSKHSLPIGKHSLPIGKHSLPIGSKEVREEIKEEKAKVEVKPEKEVVEDLDDLPF